MRAGWLLAQIKAEILRSSRVGLRPEPAQLDDETRRRPPRARVPLRESPKGNIAKLR